MSLKRFRNFGSAHAIPLQVIAVLLALLDTIYWAGLAFYFMNKLDDHNRLLGLGPLGWGSWFLLLGTVFSGLLLWLITKLWDADLNDRRAGADDAG